MQTDRRKAAGLRYVGGGDFIPGVPARDLTPAEAAQYAAQVKGSRLYVRQVAPESAPAAPDEVRHAEP